jgi:hypothetical protein
VCNFEFNVGTGEVALTRVGSVNGLGRFKDHTIDLYFSPDDVDRGRENVFLNTD